MRFGAVGDIHGDFAALDRAMSRHPDVSFWLCPGDVASDEGRYPTPVAPLYWIKGNNEDFDFIARETTEPGSIANLHYLPNAVAVQIAGLTVAGLGGTLAPTWYDTLAQQLPRPAGRSKEARRRSQPAASRGWGPAPLHKDDKRRHFVREEIEACCRLRGVDIFLSHEAPRPFMVEPADRSRSGAGHWGPASGATRAGVGAPRVKTSGVRRIDAGKKPINEVLAAMQPRLHLFGHHHRFTESVREHVRSIGLDQGAASYLILELEGESLEYERITNV